MIRRVYGDVHASNDSDRDGLHSQEVHELGQELELWRTQLAALVTQSEAIYPFELAHTCHL